jgi:hypothetical protein
VSRLHRESDGKIPATGKLRRSSMVSKRRIKICRTSRTLLHSEASPQRRGGIELALLMHALLCGIINRATVRHSS